MVIVPALPPPGSQLPHEGDGKPCWQRLMGTDGFDQRRKEGRESNKPKTITCSYVQLQEHCREEPQEPAWRCSIVQTAAVCGLQIGLRSQEPPLSRRQGSWESDCSRHLGVTTWNTGCVSKHDINSERVLGNTRPLGHICTKNVLLSERQIWLPSHERASFGFTGSPRQNNLPASQRGNLTLHTGLQAC